MFNVNAATPWKDSVVGLSLWVDESDAYPRKQPYTRSISGTTLLSNWHLWNESLTRTWIRRCEWKSSVVAVTTPMQTASASRCCIDDC
jgi:hypothetical protein